MNNARTIYLPVVFISFYLTVGVLVLPPLLLLLLLLVNISFWNNFRFIKESYTCTDQYSSNH